MPPVDAADLSQRLARQAEALCWYYLPNGRKQGNYWLVGDVRNAPGRSMFVRLTGPASGKGAAGKWTDGQSGEHGDLLDIIRESLDLTDFPDVADEARRFLCLPQLEPAAEGKTRRWAPTASGSSEAAARLWRMSRPIRGTLASTYLRSRGLRDLHATDNLRFHPTCYYRPEGEGSTETWPALIARITDLDGQLTGVHRTWLARDGSAKAPPGSPRKAMGDLLGHGVRFGPAQEIMAAGEGLETVLSLRQVLPKMPMVAALSAGHLAAIRFPALLRRLYIIRDNDAAGDAVRDSLTARAHAAGIEAITLSPSLGDFNDDLRGPGLEALRAQIRVHLAPEDVSRFMALR